MPKTRKEKKSFMRSLNLGRNILQLNTYEHVQLYGGHCPAHYSTLRLHLQHTTLLNILIKTVLQTRCLHIQQLPEYSAYLEQDRNVHYSW